MWVRICTLHDEHSEPFAKSVILSCISVYLFSPPHKYPQSDSNAPFLSADRCALHYTIRTTSYNVAFAISQRPVHNRFTLAIGMVGIEPTMMFYNHHNISFPLSIPWASFRFKKVLHFCLVPSLRSPSTCRSNLNQHFHSL